MKVAICISGQPRNVVKGFEYIEPNLLALNDCDVYIHSWWDEEQVGQQFINAGSHVASERVTEDTLDIIQSLYHPLSMTTEPQIGFDTADYVDNIYPAIKPFSSLSQKYSSMKVHEQRRARNIQYDAVVRLRFDYALQTPIRVEDFDLDAVNVPNRCPHRGGIDDTFAIGNEKVMDVYGDLYNNIFGLYKKGIPFCDELLLGEWMRIQNVEVRLHPIQYDLIRG